MSVKQTALQYPKFDKQLSQNNSVTQSIKPSNCTTDKEYTILFANWSFSARSSH